MTTTIVAFSAENVCRLTGLTMRQLGYWDKTGFFHPRYADGERRLPNSRVYDFRDVVGLRTIALLRNKYNVSLQYLRKVGGWLAEQYEMPWASLRFYVGGGKVYFDEPDTRERMASHQPGQTSFTFEMVAVEQEMAREAERLKERVPEDIGHVVQSREVLHNVPRLAGTRIPTSVIWSYHEEGYASEDILRAYPRLTERDVDAAITYEQTRHVKHTG